MNRQQVDHIAAGRCIVIVVIEVNVEALVQINIRRIVFVQNEGEGADFARFQTAGRKTITCAKSHMVPLVTLELEADTGVVPNGFGIGIVRHRHLDRIVRSHPVGRILNAVAKATVLLAQLDTIDAGQHFINTVICIAIILVGMVVADVAVEAGNLIAFKGHHRTIGSDGALGLIQSLDCLFDLKVNKLVLLGQFHSRLVGVGILHTIQSSRIDSRQQIILGSRRGFCVFAQNNPLEVAIRCGKIHTQDLYAGLQECRNGKFFVAIPAIATGVIENNRTVNGIVTVAQFNATIGAGSGEQQTHIIVTGGGHIHFKVNVVTSAVPARVGIVATTLYTLMGTVGTVRAAHIVVIDEVDRRAEAHFRNNLRVTNGFVQRSGDLDHLRLGSGIRPLQQILRQGDGILGVSIGDLRFGIGNHLLQGILVGGGAEGQGDHLGGIVAVIRTDRLHIDGALLRPEAQASDATVVQFGGIVVIVFDGNGTPFTILRRLADTVGRLPVAVCRKAVEIRVRHFLAVHRHFRIVDTLPLDRVAITQEHTSVPVLSTIKIDVIFVGHAFGVRQNTVRIADTHILATDVGAILTGHLPRILITNQGNRTFGHIGAREVHISGGIVQSKGFREEQFDARHRFANQAIKTERRTVVEGVLESRIVQSKLNLIIHNRIVIQVTPLIGTANLLVAEADVTGGTFGKIQTNAQGLHHSGLRQEGRRHFEVSRAVRHLHTGTGKNNAITFTCTSKKFNIGRMSLPIVRIIRVGLITLEIVIAEAFFRFINSLQLRSGENGDTANPVVIVTAATAPVKANNVIGKPIGGLLLGNREGVNPDLIRQQLACVHIAATLSGSVGRTAIDQNIVVPFNRKVKARIALCLLGQEIILHSNSNVFVNAKIVHTEFKSGIMTCLLQTVELRPRDLRGRSNTTIHRPKGTGVGVGYFRAGEVDLRHLGSVQCLALCHADQGQATDAADQQSAAENQR